VYRRLITKNTFFKPPLNLSIEEEEEEEVQQKALEVLDTVDPDVKTGKISDTAVSAEGAEHESAAALDTLPKFTRRSNMKGDSFVKSNTSR
jgi:hypothetical protein